MSVFDFVFLILLTASTTLFPLHQLLCWFKSDMITGNPTNEPLPDYYSFDFKLSDSMRALASFLFQV